MGSVPNFLPSQNGFRFTNAWPSEPDVVVDVFGLGRIPIGNASNGLCGGMAFAVRDYFEAKRPPPSSDRPAHGTPLFTYIVQRLIDSFDVPRGVVRYYEWMSSPDADTHIWIVDRPGVWSRTIREEWPKIKADIDAGHPSCLGIIAAHSSDPADLGRNHQVLAYAYSRHGFDLQLSVYDPNTDHGSSDTVRLSLNTRNPAQPGPIESNIQIPDPVRGFFRVSYTAVDPPADAA